MSTSIAATSPHVLDATVAGRQSLFEAAWLAHQPGAPLPRWDEFLPVAGDSSSTDLAFRLKVPLGRRAMRAGQSREQRARRVRQRDYG